MEIDERIKISREYVKKLRKEYIELHIKEQVRPLLNRDDNIETGNTVGYHGREILELLQNADDAYQKSINNGEKPPKPPEVTICYKGNTLTVTNSGAVFDEDGICAITSGYNSDKPEKSYIGNKGIGFRSILNWASAVRIHSGSFHVEFSKVIAKRYFDRVKHTKQIAEQLKKNPGLHFPMLAVPKYINGECEYLKNETTIEIDIDPDKPQDDYSVLNQIQNIDLRILLFLPHTYKINIFAEDSQITYQRTVKKDKDHKYVTLEKIVNGERIVEERYQLFEKFKNISVDKDDELKKIGFTIAVPENIEDFRVDHIYSFFPLLGMDSPFKCVLHATYDLSYHRNTTNLTAANHTIIKEQLDFLFEIADRYVNEGQHAKAQQLLLPSHFSPDSRSFSPPFSEFEDHYFDLLFARKIFRTVNGKNISVKEDPKMISGKYPGLFKGDAFDKLLEPIENKNVISMIRYLAKRNGISIEYETQELCDAINTMSDSWSEEQQVKVFIWWNEFLRNAPGGDALPKLLKKQDGKWLSYNAGEKKAECLFLDGEIKEKELPSWTKIPALDKSYQNELFSKAKQTERVKEAVKSYQEAREGNKDIKMPSISRIICRNNIFPAANFRYNDRSTIISTVNSSVDSYDMAVEFVEWLWREYHSDKSWNPPEECAYRFPAKGKSDYRNIEELYFGSDYRNSLAEKLFNTEAYKAFPPVSEFNIEISDEEKDEDAFRSFIKKFGVKDFPEIQIKDLTPIPSYRSIYEKEIKDHSYISYKLPYISGLSAMTEDLPTAMLEELPTATIVHWLVTDDLLREHLKYRDVRAQNVRGQNAEIKYQPKGRGRHPHLYTGELGIRNYIREVFNDSKWIEIDGKRYSPREVLKGYSYRNNSEFKELIPVLTEKMINNIVDDLKHEQTDIDVDIDKVKDIFELFDLADRLIDLSSEDFYGLLLKIPAMSDRSKGLDLFKKIYNTIEHSTPLSDDAKILEDSKNEGKNKKEFMNNGKVRVCMENEFMFYSANEAYVPSTLFVKKNLFPIVDKGARTDNKAFIDIFGCKKYDLEYTVKKDGIFINHPANDKFQKYYAEFREYAQVFSLRNGNIAKHGNKLKITLVSRIDIIKDGKVETLNNDYELVRDSVTNWYIIVSEPDYDLEKTAQQIENIFENIANSPGFDARKLGILFMVENEVFRKHIIIGEFGTDYIIDSDLSKEKKERFIEAVKQLNPDYDIETIDIDFDDYTSADNAPHIIRILKELEADVKELQDAGFNYRTDLASYHKKQLEIFITDKKISFKNYLFRRAKENESLQKSFIRDVQCFEDYFEDPSLIAPDEKLNSAYFDFKEILREKYPDWKIEESGHETESDEAQDEFYRNYDELVFKKGIETESLKEEIYNDLTVQNMIRFYHKDDFEKWLDEFKEQEQKNAEESVCDYSELDGVIPELSEPEYTPIKPGISDSSRKNGRTGIGHFNTADAEKRRRQLKIIGNKGEKYICNLLRDKEKFPDIKKVFYRSEAFKEMGMALPSDVRSGKFDLYYQTNDGDFYFVEVKAQSGNERPFSFFITPGELEFAKKHPDNFKLFFVYDIKSGNPKCFELPAKFWEDNEHFRQHEIVEISYAIEF